MLESFKIKKIINKVSVLLSEEKIQCFPNFKILLLSKNRHKKLSGTVKDSVVVLEDYLCEFRKQCLEKPDKIKDFKKDFLEEFAKLFESKKYSFSDLGWLALNAIIGIFVGWLSSKLEL